MLAKELLEDARAGNLDKVKEIVGKMTKQELNGVKSSWDFTPMHKAAQKNHPEVIKVLADAGADLEPKTKNLGFGRTPLAMAAGDGNAEAVKMLLELGADLNAKDDNGKSVVELACMHNYKAMGRDYPETQAALDAECTDSMKTVQGSGAS